MSQPWDKEFRSQTTSKKKKHTFRKVVDKAETVVYAIAMVSIVYVAIAMHTVKTARR